MLNPKKLFISVDSFIITDITNQTVLGQGGLPSIQWRKGHTMQVLSKTVDELELGTL